MPRSIGAASSASSAAPPPTRTRFVGRAARRASRRARARGRSSARRRRRAPPSACRGRRAWATPSWISGSGRLRHALGVERARQRAREPRRVGEVDRRRGDARAQAADQRAAALGVGEPVEGQRAEELEQRADRVGLEDDRVLAGLELGRARRAATFAAARSGDRRRVEVARRPRPRPAAQPAAAVARRGR